MSNVKVFQELCKGVEGCGICVYVCRSNVFKPGLALNRKGYRPPKIAAPDACTSCENCMIFCPDLAIAVGAKPKKGRGEK